jgi:hypothetical protein
LPPAEGQHAAEDQHHLDQDDRQVLVHAWCDTCGQR